METWPCTSQFLKLGPEILTRDLNQTKKKLKVRCKKQKYALFPASRFSRNFGPAVEGLFFFASRFSRNFGPAVEGLFFFVLHPSLNVLLSLFEITCQNFTSKLQKMDVILRYCPDQGLLPGPARMMMLR